MDPEVFLGCACELLAIPSTSDRPAELRRALDYVLDFVGPGFTVERFESGGKPSALVYPAKERGDFRVILNAHLDVVPAPPDQFRPRRDGDRLFARGAQDMKVTGLLGAQVFRELAASLSYPLALQLVTDEEVGGRDGTMHQLDRGVRGRFVIVGETSGLRIVNESKGMLVVRLAARGRPGRPCRLPVARRQRPGQAAKHGGQPAGEVSRRDRGGLAHHREPRPRRHPERGAQPGARRRGGVA
jgi:succinyl-diaminopimelate desuccinylase